MLTCEVSDAECVSPAGWGNSVGFADNKDGPSLRTKCYVCGQPVCVRCSRLTTWTKKRVRACETCVPAKREEQDRG